jgi:hypothetical protein
MKIQTFCVRNTQVDQLADMISSVFMLHSGSNLQTFAHLDTDKVIRAAEYSIHTFFEQVKGYIEGTVDLVKNLPEEIAGLPKNVRKQKPFSCRRILLQLEV